MDNIGFIGLGIMGKPMATNLLKSGLTVHINDIDSSKYKELELLGAEVDTIKNIGENCNVIFLSLPDGEATKKVLLTDNSLYHNMKPQTVIIDTSSVNPSEAMHTHDRLIENDIFYLDAPMSGGEKGAVEGTLAFMVGGNEEKYKKIYQYLDILGTSATYMGNSGSGSLTKLTNQMIVNLNIAVLSESIVFAVKGGLDPQNVYKAIRNGLAGSAVLENSLPRIFNRDFKPGGKISTNQKDINNVLDTAHRINSPTPLSSYLYEIQQALKVHGLEDEDHSSYVKFFEKMANVEVKKLDENV